MSGFFKKLFNRIAGNLEEQAPSIEEARTLPAPEPEMPAEPEPELQPEAEPRKPEPVAIETAEPDPVPDLNLAGRLEVTEELSGADTDSPEPPPFLAPHREEEESFAGPERKKTAPMAKARPKSKPKVKTAIVRPVPEPEIRVPAAEPELVPEPKIIRPPEPELQPVPVQVDRKGWLTRLTAGLSKSSKTITGSITSIFTKRKLDAATVGELEDVLIQADLGLPMAERIVKAVSAGRYDKEIEPEEVKRILAEEVAKVLRPVEMPFNFGTEKPFVILVVGVNGSGKTTTIGKLGAIATNEGFKVMFAACDTFRAAAIEQLTLWGERVGATTVSRPTGFDSSGLAFDAMTEARETGADILFIDTAGRLQNKAYLMDELDKVVRVIKKQDAGAPHAVLLVLDATTGQNAIAQAEIFTKVAGVTGLIMTKLDGTARGGILVAIAEKFKLPVHAIGVGERVDDLQPFEAEAFSRAIAGLEVAG